MIFPKKINKGDTVGLISPSSSIDSEREIKCVAAIEGLGFKVKKADNISRNYGGYMAGTGKERGEWINRMFQDDEVNAIFCIRGGSGGNRAMEYIDTDIVKKNPKIFVGYSDVTSMHLLFNQKCDLITFHGPMVSSNIVDKFDKETSDSLFNTINVSRDYDFQNPEGFEFKVLKEGYAEGKLIGGNLSLIAASMGTEYEINTENSILFVEEVHGDMEEIDRNFYTLRNSGKLAKLQGLILGQFTDCTNEHIDNYGYLDVVRDALENINIPIMYNIQSGHGFPMMTLPLGTDCVLDTKRKKIRFHLV